MHRPDSPEDYSRRAVLRGLAGGAGLAAASGSAIAQSTTFAADVNYQGWFSNVSNFAGTVDRRGEDEVRIQVGAQGNTGYFAFAPAAVRVDPGTTIIWEWTGRGGAHNVVDLDGDFESELTGDAGHTFRHSYETEGVYKYYCNPHRSAGMKGAIVVGDVTGPAAGGGLSWSPPGEYDQPFVWLFFGSLGLGVFAVLGAEAYRDVSAWRAARAAAADVTSQEAASYEPTVEIGHDEYDPTGTAALVLLYLLVLVVMWLLMYFVEFLGGGPTVVG